MLSKDETAISIMKENVLSFQKGSFKLKNEF